jgi:hypothetical protein
MAMTPPSSDWVIDSGASYHTTPTTGTLSRSHPPIPVIFIDRRWDRFHSACHLSRCLSSPWTVLPQRRSRSPHITHNLLSVRRFTTDNSCSIEFDPSGFSVKDLATRTPLTRCDSSGPLYTLRPSTSGASPPPALVSTTSSTTWHHRLGHPEPDVMTKITRLPFTTSSRAEQAFDLVHCDLWTSPVLSLSGYKYYLVILDDFSHFLWTFPLRLKSDTFTTITHFFAWVSTQFHRPVRALQCDNGREFDNHASHSFFLTHGVQLHLSCPYTSAQNGRAELKGKCALGPFLSILVIECQRKCFCVDLCNVVDKVQIMSKGMFLDLVHYLMD